MSGPVVQRQMLDHEAWQQLADAPDPPLLALWADTREIHALLHDGAAAPLLVSTVVEAGRYPALSGSRRGAAWFERMIRDLWGHEAAGGADQRPWLDHGRWPQAAPMALRPGPPGGSAEPPEFLPAAEAELDQIPLGPVRGIIEPAVHLRLSGRGETIVRLETRLGYSHKGVLTLMRGKSPRAAARFAARLAAEATVAHAIAFSRAAEAALAAEVPPRGVSLRGVMAELERIASHLAALTAIADAAGWVAPAVRLARQEEAIRQAALAAFGHRLMMDCVVPGGLAADIAPGGTAAIRGALAAVPAALPDPASPALSGLGVVTAQDAARLAAGGIVGRAAGRGCDVRRHPGYPPYDSMPLLVPVVTAGDAECRMRLRLSEVAESVRLVRALLDDLPAGPVSESLPVASGEGVGFAEGPGGDVWHWLRLDHGQIASLFMRDPGWAQWPLLEAAMAGGQADDLPLVLATFGPGCSGMDL